MGIKKIKQHFGIPYNCKHNGKPACGSGLLSYWASIKAGVPDLRNYYEVDIAGEEDHMSNILHKSNNLDIHSIVDKLVIHKENKDFLPI